MCFYSPCSCLLYSWPPGKSRSLNISFTSKCFGIRSDNYQCNWLDNNKIKDLSKSTPLEKPSIRSTMRHPNPFTDPEIGESFLHPPTRYARIYKVPFNAIHLRTLVLYSQRGSSAWKWRSRAGRSLSCKVQDLVRMVRLLGVLIILLDKVQRASSQRYRTRIKPLHIKPLKSNP
jgi:hypothetical protein